MGTNPQDVAITPDGTKAYVANSNDSDVNVIDVSTDSITGTPISVGTIPWAIAITPLPLPRIPEISGVYCKNTFLSQKELFVVITWCPISDNDVTQYSIFRDDELVAIIPVNDPREFVDHNREKNRTYEYRVVAENTFGVTLAEGSISVTCR